MILGGGGESGRGDPGREESDMGGRGEVIQHPPHQTGVRLQH